MRSFPIANVVAALLAVALGGCFPRVLYPEREMLSCPEPPVICAPTRTDAVTLDTAAIGSGSHYLSISLVDGLDTDIDEYSLAFIGRAEGLATVRSRRGGIDRLLQIALDRVNRVGRLLEVPLNGERTAVGGGAQSADGSLVSTRSERSLLGDYDLHIAKGGTMPGVGMSIGERLPISANVAWDAQPAISPDGTTIYFASDRRGTNGGVDLWRSVRRADGRWGEPENLGLSVNTPCDELSPWVSGDGKWLYFSSSGHATVGGYDLFRAAIRSDGSLGAAENLGRPINTPGDELFPSAPADASPDTLLYYSSNQTGSNGFDLYVLHRLPRARAAQTPTQRRDVDLTGVVLDPSGRPVDSAVVYIEERDPPRRDSTVTDPQGRYRFRVKEGKTYELIAGSDSTLFLREVVKVPTTDGRTTYTHDIQIPDTVTFRVNFPFNNATDPYEYTLDERGLPSDLRWSDMIDGAALFLRTQNGTASRFEIVGHTDPVGSDEFNLDLGRRRAEFIRRELVRRGVAAAILTVRSEGEGRPLARREGESEELYHARLRRVELVRRK